jgi:hypothetical protein
MVEPTVMNMWSGRPVPRPFLYRAGDMQNTTADTDSANTL